MSYTMNKLIERELSASITSLDACQLQNVLTHYERLIGTLAEKSFTKPQRHYKCQIALNQYKANGFGRSEQQALNNSTKNLFFTLIGEGRDIEIIKQCLKNKNIELKSESGCNQNSVLLDEISIIRHEDSHLEEPSSQATCDCVFYEMHQSADNQVKHLKARISLLSEENTMLKKFLLHGNTINHCANSNKENQSLQANR